MEKLLDRLGRACARHRYVVVAAWMLAAGIAVGAAGAFGGAITDRLTIPGSDSEQAITMLSERFPEMAGGSAQLVFESSDGRLADPGPSEVVSDALTEVSGQPHVLGVGELRLGADRTIGYADVTYDRPSAEIGPEVFERLRQTADRTGANGIRMELGGEIPSDIDAAAQDPSGQEVAGLVAAFLVLLVAFGSMVAMALPILTALFGLATSAGIIGLLAAVMDVSDPAQTLAVMVGVGVGIDYALLIVTRHRANLRAGTSVEAAAGRAIATAGSSVASAALTVMIAICGLVVVGIPFIGVVGFMAAIAVGVMAAAALTLVPALLGIAGQRINALRIPGTGREPRGRGETLWHRFARRVTDRPWPWLLGGLAVLLALTGPALTLRLGMPDAGLNPPSTTTRQAYDLIAEGFGDGHNGPLLIAVEGDPTSRKALDDLARAVAADPGVAEVGPALVNESGSAAVISAVPISAPQDEATAQLLHRLRDTILPDAIADTDLTAHVGGQTAMFIDLADRIGSRMPWFIGLVLALSMMLLTFVFRSIVVPVKAAAMNLLSISAAFGVVVAIFQWGWGQDIFAVEQPMPVVVFVPVLMFAILFGLSMDYEVFLLSRIREEYRRTGDNDTAVIEGVAATGRVITAAALVMVSVFTAFALGDSPIIKMLGIGMATAILLDATLVRTVVVPALMSLLGDRNWWLPGVRRGSGMPRSVMDAPAPPGPAATTARTIQSSSSRAGTVR